MMDEDTSQLSPLDAEELMLLGDRIDALPADDARWVRRLFDECLRARMREAELLEAGSGEESPGGETRESEAQLAQVVLDAAEWLKTLWDVGYMGAASFPTQPRSAFPVVELEDVLKSSLFARIREGKRPLPFPPPTRNGLPWHDLVEGAAEAHPVAAEITRVEHGRPVAAMVEGCPHWQVIEELTAGSEYLLQHRSKGPLYRLCLAPFFSTLQREAPRWERQIRLQERAGLRSFVLLWPGNDAATKEIPLRAATWERAESEAAYWIATNSPEMYGQVRFERVETTA